MCAMGIPSIQIPKSVDQNHSKSFKITVWLVVDLPLWRIWEPIGMIIPNIWKNKKCLKPPTSCFTWYDRKRPSRYLLAFGHLVDLVIHSLTHLPHISTSPIPPGGSSLHPSAARTPRARWSPCSPAVAAAPRTPWTLREGDPTPTSRRSWRPSTRTWTAEPHTLR